MTDKQSSLSNLDLGNVDLQDLLNQILATGKDLVKQGKAQTRDLTVKGKELAFKGEDCLLYTSPSPRD